MEKIAHNIGTSNLSGDWTFRNSQTRENTHSYHDYPARMIPQIAEKLLNNYGIKNGIMFDPYCGSGTSLVEAVKHEMIGIGFDLNPLARLIAEGKTHKLNLTLLNRYQVDFTEYLLEFSDKKNLSASFKVEGISDVNFWFKKPIIKKLIFIKDFIDSIQDTNVQAFFKIAFSETVREASNTRNDEFKLYRYAADKLEKHNPDPFVIIQKKLDRNIPAYKKMKLFMGKKTWHTSRVYNLNSCLPISPEVIAPASVDVVITSPPYGDSRTTVAYGQYSRLSSAWLGFEKPESVDKNLMGGKKKKIALLPSKKINAAINKIAKVDQGRAEEVFSFYQDLFDSITNVSKVVKSGGHVCYVVGNRRVKDVVLPTDIAVKDFFEENGFIYVDTLIREIPNKRMPSKNSPSNQTGQTSHTMLNEYVVVLKKP